MSLSEKLTSDARVINFNVDEKGNWCVECINKNSVAEEILDLLREKLGEDDYKFGIKSYASYWKEETNKETFVVYANKKE